MDWFFLFLALFWVAWVIFKGYKEGRNGKDSDNTTQADEPKKSKWEYRKPGQPTHRITYTDADGNTTQRNISLYKTGHTNAKCEAWCETRQERRTFLFDRVQHAIDLSTGEVLTKAGFFSAVHPTRRVPDTLKN